MAKTLLAVLLILSFSLILLCVGIIFRHDHKFSSEDVGDSKEMRKRGIKCYIEQDADIRSNKGSM
jgi:hypothetical protein